MNIVSGSSGVGVARCPGVEATSVPGTSAGVDGGVDVSPLLQAIATHRAPMASTSGRKPARPGAGITVTFDMVEYSSIGPTALSKLHGPGFAPYPGVRQPH